MSCLVEPCAVRYPGNFLHVTAGRTESSHTRDRGERGASGERRSTGPQTDAVAKTRARARAETQQTRRAKKPCVLCSMYRCARRPARAAREPRGETERDRESERTTHDRPDHVLVWPRAGPESGFVDCWELRACGVVGPACARCGHRAPARREPETDVVVEPRPRRSQRRLPRPRSRVPSEVRPASRAVRAACPRPRRAARAAALSPLRRGALSSQAAGAS